MVLVEPEAMLDGLLQHTVDLMRVGTRKRVREIDRDA